MSSSPEFAHPLPIDQVLDPLRRALKQSGCVVLQAEPGAGKTTRVPLALLDQPWLGSQRIIMLEPRRLAAIHAARYMSQLLGEEVGQTVGYSIRHQRAVSRHTRIEVVTEGVLTRRLQRDPTLDGVGLIIFDEFHERNLHSDLGLALSYDVQQGLRDDLKLLVMSATLDSDAVARLLGGAPVLHSRGRNYPVTIHYLAEEALPFPQRVVNAVRQALGEQQDDLLVFLPGAAEIQRCLRLLSTKPWAEELMVCPLYGALPFSEQQRALQPAEKRKVVLATNIAETSLTIDGIGAVIDSGLERQLGFDAASGMDRLVTHSISQASATQRAGRAGRQSAGHCYRLWSEARQLGLRPYSVPEIARTDLTALALELVAWGVPEAESLNWLDPPPSAHLAAAFHLLQQLGAIDEQRRLTVVGRQMSRLPLHPRLGRMVVAAAGDNQQRLACQLAVVLESPRLFPSPSGQTTTASDLLDRLERWQPHRTSRTEQGGWHQARQSYQALCRQLKINPAGLLAASGEDVGPLLLWAYPDRLARLRPGQRGHYLMRGGRGAQLSSRSNLDPTTDWLVAAEVDFGGDGEALIHVATQIDEPQLLATFGDLLEWQDEALWDAEQQRVVARQVRRLDALVLAQRPAKLQPQQVVPVLIKQLQKSGLNSLNWTRDSRGWLQRARFVAATDVVDNWPLLDDGWLLDHLEQWLGPWLSGISGLAAVKKMDLLEPLRSLLSWSQQQQLERLAPLKIKVPSGSHIAIDYSDAAVPVLAVKLQELFGWQATPRIADQRVALTLHLLSPARRPIQVTQDLANFWASTYPEVKKELKGRYPKHPWPDNPLQAPAQRGVKQRR